MAQALVAPGATTDSMRDLLKVVRYLSAAFPRSAWKSDSDAVYAMTLASEHIPSDVAFSAVTELVKECDELPAASVVLRKCRELNASQAIRDWACPVCASRLVAGTVGGPGVCFDCDWEGVL